MLGPCAVSVRRHALLWSWHRRRPGSFVIPLSPSLAPCALVSRVVGEDSFPYLPLSVLPRHYFSLGGHPRGFVPLGQLLHSVGVNSLWRLDSPSPSLAVPPRVFCHSGGLAAPLPAPHSLGNFGRVFLPTGNPFPYPRYRPMAASHSHLVCGCGGDHPGVDPAV